MKTNLYVAYGIDLNTVRMSQLCQTAKPIAKSWLHDYRLVFRGKPYGAQATIEPREDVSVPVVVWEISPTDEKSISFWNEADGGTYEMKHISVEVDGEMKDALVLIMNERDAEIRGVPNNTHLELMVQGYKSFNLDLNILTDALITAHQESIIKEAYKTL